MEHLDILYSIWFPRQYHSLGGVADKSLERELNFGVPKLGECLCDLFVKTLRHEQVGVKDDSDVPDPRNYCELVPWLGHLRKPFQKTPQK